jgi:hypothetical protein
MFREHADSQMRDPGFVVACWTVPSRVRLALSFAAAVPIAVALSLAWQANGDPTSALPPTLLFLLLLWLLAFRSRLVLRNDSLEARNPVGSFRLARSQVASAAANYLGVVITDTAGKRRTAFVAQRSNVAVVRGVETHADRIAKEIERWAKSAERSV